MISAFQLGVRRTEWIARENRSTRYFPADDLGAAERQSVRRGCPPPHGEAPHEASRGFVVAALLFPATLSARPLYLFGQIGKSVDHGDARWDGDALSGSLCLICGIGKELDSSGRINADRGFQLDGAVKSRSGSASEAKLDGGQLDREWPSPTAARRSLHAERKPDTLAAVSGAFRCFVQRNETGPRSTYEYRSSSKKIWPKGTVKGARHAEFSKSSKQVGGRGFFYALERLRQSPAPTSASC